MTKKITIEDTNEAWESGELGREEEHLEVVELDEGEIDKSLELQLISIRLQKSLIEDFKLIAGLHGLGYQPLMRQVLNRFAESEKKQILRKVASQIEKETAEAARQSAEEETHNKRIACG